MAMKDVELTGSLSPGEMISLDEASGGLKHFRVKIKWFGGQSSMQVVAADTCSAILQALTYMELEYESMKNSGLIIVTAEAFDDTK